MEARAVEAGEYWSNYLQFQANIAQDREKALSDIEQIERMGRVAPEQADARRAEVEATYSSRMQELKSGPTYQLLQEEYDAQRGFAEQQWQREQGALLDSGGRPVIRQEYREAVPAYYEEGSLVTPEQPAGWYTISESAGEDTYEVAEFGSASGPVTPGGAPFEFAASVEEYFGGRFGTESTPSAAPGAPYRPTGRPVQGGGGGADDEGIGVGQVYSWY